jgi:transposase-like protein
MTGFKSFATASITISGIELAHRIHQRQYSFGRGRRPQEWSLKQQWEQALA